MTQFHEGQKVEVWGANMYPWRKAKIVNEVFPTKDWPSKTSRYEVQFPDNTHALFDAEHISVGKFQVSSNDPMGTRPANKDEIEKWWLSDLAQELDEKLQREGKP